MLVVINDAAYPARSVAKINTSNVAAFDTPNRGPAAILNTAKVYWLEVPAGRRGARSEFTIEGVSTLPRVDVIYAHANMSADLIDAAVANGAQGHRARGRRRRQCHRSGHREADRRGEEGRGRRAQLAAAHAA